MDRLTSDKDTEIRNMLDDIQDRLYHNCSLYEDLYWSHTTIKELLFIIYMLQDDLEKCKGVK